MPGVETAGVHRRNQLAYAIFNGGLAGVSQRINLKQPAINTMK